MEYERGWREEKDGLRQKFGASATEFIFFMPSAHGNLLWLARWT